MTDRCALLWPVVPSLMRSGDSVLSTGAAFDVICTETGALLGESSSSNNYGHKIITLVGHAITAGPHALFGETFTCARKQWCFFIIGGRCCSW